jgi:uridine phosphorylase
MAVDDSITYPFKGKNDPKIGPLAVLVSNQADLERLCELLDVDKNNHRKLLMSRIYSTNRFKGTFSITGPLIGAPYTVLVFENLIARGARHFIFFGWCGAVSRNIAIGDIIIPTAAVIDEGTSRHYAADVNRAAVPSVTLLEKIRTSFNKTTLPVHRGLVWTTDAIYRETKQKVSYFQQKKVLAVEMEVSALFTVGSFRRVDTAAILVVSDEISSLEWRRGFGNRRFINNRKAALEAIGRLCRTTQIPLS